MTGWALLCGDAGAARRWLQQPLPHEVTTIVRTPAEALALLGSGQVAGVLVLDYSQLFGLIEEVRPPSDAPGERRPRLHPDRWPGARRPEVNPHAIPAGS
jgi:hypothetical protein